MEQAPEQWRRQQRPRPQLQLTPEQQAQAEQLAALLLCKPPDVQRIIAKYPKVLL